MPFPVRYSARTMVMNGMGNNIMMMWYAPMAKSSMLAGSPLNM